MLTRIKTTRIAPMAKTIHIPASPFTRLDILNELRKEIEEGHKSHDQNAFITYLFVEHAYIGCVRYSEGFSSGHDVRIKMYNSTADDTRDIIADASSRIGETISAFFNHSDKNCERHLNALVDAWYGVQFRTDDTDNLYLHSSYRELPNAIVNLQTSSHINAFVKASDHAILYDSNVAVCFFDDDDDYPVMKAFFNAGGGGELWVCIAPVVYGKKDNVKKPSLWRRCLRWEKAPLDGVDFPRTTQIINSTIFGTNRHNMLTTFPTPFHIANQRQSRKEEICV